MKKLYLVEPNEKQIDDRGFYDVYLGFVICADSEDEARNLSFSNPCYDKETDEESDKQLDHSHWIPEESKHLLNVKYIGIADKGIEKGCVLYSFRAG